jgi:hypothetical protein
VTVVQLEIVDAAPADPFMPALAVARALQDKRQRALTLQQIATAEADASLHHGAAIIFAEAVWLASHDAETLSTIADAQRRAGLIEDAAATFEEALTASMAGDERSRAFKLTSLVHLIADNGRGSAMIAASPPLGSRLLEAAEAIPGGLDRAAVLSVIAPSLPE